MDLVSWTFLALATWVPVEHHRYYEPTRVTVARYELVAEAIADAAREAPIDGDVSWTAALLASTVAAESFVRRDVVECRRDGYGGKRPARGAFQLVTDRATACDVRAAAAAAREVLRGSFTACARQPETDRLAFYLSGRCDRGLGQARWRYRRALAWWRAADVT